MFFENISVCSSHDVNLTIIYHNLGSLMDIKTGLNLQRCFNASGRLRIVAAINVLIGVYYYPIEQADFPLLSVSGQID